MAQPRPSPHPGLPRFDASAFLQANIPNPRDISSGPCATGSPVPHVTVAHLWRTPHMCGATPHILPHLCPGAFSASLHYPLAKAS